MSRGEERERYVFLETFGCQMNANDSERILGQLATMNYRATNDPEGADLILLNTCSIREKAEHKVYSALGRYRGVKRKKPHTIIGVGGCVGQQQGERLLKRLDYLDIVFGTATIHRLPELIQSVDRDRGQREATELATALAPDEFAITPFRDSPYKAFITIMRGCDNFCSYCIVPYVRGREASRSAGSIVDEVEGLAASGVREITLIGQNVNSYGNDGGGTSFPALVKTVCGVDGIERVRFTTSHPKDLSVELIDLIAGEEKICNHLHLPVQSGSDAVLKKMGRGYTRTEYLHKVSLLKELSPEISLTTDIIVGFPGEGDNDFNDTVKLLNEVEFDNFFSFKYSPRPMTKAASFAEQVDEDVKSARLQTVQKLQSGITLAKNKRLAGESLDVLVEGKAKTGDALLTGRTSCNRVVNFPGAEEWSGETVQVTIQEGFLNSLKGVVKGVNRC